jgi:hypothetical protein
MPPNWYGDTNPAMLYCLFEHFVSPDDSTSHIHCSTDKLYMSDLIDLYQFAGVILS